MTGDANEASENVERALIERRPVSAEAFEAVLLEVRQAVKRLGEAPMVQDDALACRILDEMALAQDMEEFTAGLERLDLRMQLLAKRKSAQPRSADAPPRAPRAARTLLKL